MGEYLTIEGLIFLILAWGSVFTLTGYCFYKVLTTGTDLEEVEKAKQEESSKD